MSGNHIIFFSSQDSWQQAFLEGQGFTVLRCVKLENIPTLLRENPVALIIATELIPEDYLENLTDRFPQIKILLIARAEYRQLQQNVFVLRPPVLPPRLAGLARKLTGEQELVNSRLSAEEQRELEEVILPAFRTNLCKRLIQVKESMKQRDSESVRRLCHDLTIASSLGYPDITRAAKNIGAALREGEFEKAKLYVEALSDSVNKIIN